MRVNVCRDAAPVDGLLLAFVGHDGGVPGFYSVMARIPSSNLGVAVFTNDGTYGLYFMYVIMYRILDELLGLNVSDTDSL